LIGNLAYYPGSHCAYASVYLTVCLIRIFELATRTFEEQQSHIQGLAARMEEVSREPQAALCQPCFAGVTHTRAFARPSQVAELQTKEDLCSSPSSQSCGDGWSFGGGVDLYEVHLNATREEVEDMMTQILRFDPYPCILGIPVKPRLFSRAKVVICLCFLSLGSRITLDLLRGLLAPVGEIV
jgi:hypothetical protein